MRRSWRSWFVITLAIVLLGTATACTQPSGTPSAIAVSPEATPSPTTSPVADPSMAAPAELPQAFSNLPQLQGTATILLTVKGKPIKLEVDGKHAPITAGNFVDLVQKNVYDGLVFHRVVKQPEPFVVQGGDPQGRDPNVPVGKLGTGGYIDPATQQERRIPLEIKPASASKTLYETTFSMAGLTEKPLLTHKRGALAMARSADPNSASSQFYITLADQNFLDGEYAVFGYVTEGMDVVDNIQQGDRIDSAKVLEIKGEFKPGK